MGKSKHGTALYEVLRKDNLSDQQAWVRAPEQFEEPLEPRAEPSEEAPAPTVEPVLEVSPPSPPPVMPVATPDVGPGEPIWRIAEGRMHLALSSRGLGLAIFGLGCLLLIAYAVGQRSGQKRGLAQGFLNGKQATQAAAVDEIGQARAQPATQGIFDGVGDSPVQPVDPQPASAVRRADPMDPPAGPRWVKGYTYVVVQDFRADAREDARHAQQYLADSGLETAVVELSGDWKYRLVTTQGFNRDDPVQRKLADEYLSRVRSLGQTYFKAGGRYRLEGYFKKLTAPSW
ncbi:MAG: hypothetical protein ACE5GE_07795 [Phycisphaerae bacterium]